MLINSRFSVLVSRTTRHCFSVRRTCRKRSSLRRRRDFWFASSAIVESLEDRTLLATITVTSLADNTTTDSMITLREAIQAAETDTSIDGSTAGNGADTIIFDPSLTAGGDATISLTMSESPGEFLSDAGFVIETEIAIEGPTGDNGITIERDSGAAEFRLFFVQDTGNLTLDHLTLANGIDRGVDGGAMEGGGVAVGGAIFNYGLLSINKSTLTNNHVIGGNAGAGATGSFRAGGFAFGGVLWNAAGATATIQASTLQGNSATGGNGDHAGDAAGAAIYNFESTLRMFNTTVSGNTGTGGNGVSVRGEVSGGGLLHRLGDTRIVNSTFALNRLVPGAGPSNPPLPELITDGGSIFSSVDDDSTPIEVFNTILADSIGGTHEFVAQTFGADTAAFAYDSLIESSTGVTLTRVITDDPELGDLSDNGGPTLTHAIDGDSPAFDAGMNVWADANLLFTDQIGNTRFFGVTDIGAFEAQPGRIGNFVWNDVNRNGVQDDGERGIRVPGGVTVQLFSPGADGQVGGGDDEQIDSTQTNKFGVFVFEDVVPREYYLTFVLPGAGYAFTAFDVGDWKKDSNADPNTGRTEIFNLGSGKTDFTRDAGMLEPGRIGDRVWIDDNGNGELNSGELGVRIPGGMTVVLFNAGADEQIGGNDDVQVNSVQTNKWGVYQFDNVGPGKYFVQFVLPNDFNFTQQQAAGVNWKKNSDADPATGRTTVFNLAANKTDRSRDAGLIFNNVRATTASDVPPPDSSTRSAPLDVDWGELVFQSPSDPAAPPVAIVSSATPHAVPSSSGYDDEDDVLATLDELLTFDDGDTW